MKPNKNDSVSYGSKETDEGSTQAPTFGVPGASAGGMQHRVLGRKNESNMGPAGSPGILGAESANFGLPVANAGMRHTGKRG